MSRFSLLAGLSALSAAGCTAITDFDAQCVVDAECAAVGRSLVCTRGTCAMPDLVFPEVSATVPAGEASLGCYTLFGETDASADTLTLGTLLPLSGGLADEGPAMEDGVRLAVAEINQAGGINGRMLRVLACDSGTQADVAERAAQHLVDVADVPAIIGPGSSTEVIATYGSVARESGTLLISPSATSPEISLVDETGLLWRTVPSDALQGGVIAGYLAHRAYERIYVVHRDDAYGNGLASVVRNAYCDPRSCANTFRSQAYPTDDLSLAQADVHAAILADIEAFAPDAVVLVGYAPDGLSFLRLAEGKPWAFVLAEGLRTGGLVDGLRDRDGALLVPGLDDPQLLCNIVGTYPSYRRDTAGYQAFADRYRQLTGGKEPGTYSVHAYDATYALAFAAAAAAGAGVRTPRGRDLAEGLARLSHGVPVTLGSPLDGSFGTGVRALRFDALGTIDLVGLSGPLDFDANGDPASSMELWNLDPDPVLSESGGSRIVTLGTVWDGVAVDATGAGVYSFAQIPQQNASPACGAAEP